MHAAFEVAVARDDRRRNKITACNGFGYFTRQWTGITDTSGTAVRDDIETKFGKRIDQTSLVEIFSHYA